MTRRLSAREWRRLHDGSQVVTIAAGIAAVAYLVLGIVAAGAGGVAWWANKREQAVRQAPRRLSAIQRTAMLHILKPVPRWDIRVAQPTGDSEAAGFAREIAETFREASWGAHVEVLSHLSGTETGLILRAIAGELPPDRRAALVAAVKATGQPVHDQTSSAPNASIQIIVGYRPSA